MQPRWELEQPDEALVAALSRQLGVPAVVARLLVNRKVHDPAEAAAFLAPRLQHLPEPFAMKGMDAAVDRILHAIDHREPVCVWGDYDVDGVTSASQLLLFFRALGVPVGYFVPDRFTDGYGLSAPRIRELARGGVRLFVTVDCGITSVAEVEAAREEGADVVIVDHHQVPATLPRAAAILNPHQPGCAYPYKHLAACGVTWMLLIALRARLRERGHFATRPEPDLRDWLDLTSIGTVADMVPLTGVNRVIVKTGLTQIGRSRRPGVVALREVAGLGAERITAGRIGFHLGPRINAAGRVAHASAGVELLVAEDYDHALGVARQVDQHNDDRRTIQDETFRAAVAQAADLLGAGGERRTLVLGHPDWHPGVLGIVASKLVERFHRPTILLTIADGLASGSARSVAGFRLVHHLERLRDHLVKFGGHDHAAGLTLEDARRPDFCEAFERAAHEALKPEQLRPRLRLDARVPLGEVSFELVEALRQLEPHGQGNPEPTFLAEAVPVLEARPVGADRSHLKLTLGTPEAPMDAIAFGQAETAPAPGARVDVAFVPEVNVFRNQARLQLRVKALRPA